MRVTSEGLPELLSALRVCFFFQAEDGIRDLTVTGVQTCALPIYSIWVFAVNGATPHQRLAGETGTMLVPLGEVAGPAVLVMGAIFAILAMGMGSVQDRKSVV